MSDANRFSDWSIGQLGHAPNLGEHSEEIRARYESP